ncbi:Insulin-induced protein 2 protein [Willisornis vidua]|uniref:Insulin-induced gene protein n=1 Tax=Willisornis vidua TaxID=1566151 RepID=A0ABQ9CSC8_9PASS|nr:Insulin-induced protein 2 protein [Willisornis vidua]
MLLYLVTVLVSFDAFSDTIDFYPVIIAKVDFANNIQLSLTLAALSIGLWWTFDRSRSGFGLGVGIAFLATLVSQLLVYNGVYQYTSPDFLYVRSWLPCIFFAGGITMGNIGRQLAMYECKVIAEKSHED